MDQETLALRAKDEDEDEGGVAREALALRVQDEVELAREALILRLRV